MFATSSLQSSLQSSLHSLNAIVQRGLASVRKFAAAFLSLRMPLHVLINNAAVMACSFTRSVDGHELQVLA